jgi:nucleoside-diphosphate-sugar epimerase
MITNEEQLEDVLSQPTPADVEAAAKMDGDLLLLGVAGKMGPSLARRAARARESAGKNYRLIGVSRFSSDSARALLESSGVDTIAGDLLEPGLLDRLPDAPNVIYLAGRKFGSTDAPSLTWAMNVHLPGLVAERYKNARIVAFSSGNIYPLMPVSLGGASEQTLVGPVGEYAQSVLGRERMFEYGSSLYGTRVTLLRLNYAIDLRYGVLLDIGQKVFNRTPVDVSMGSVNVIWQGDANSVCLRCLPFCQSPPFVLNLTGPETVSVRWIAKMFGVRFGVEPIFTGREADTALLNNAARCQRLFGYPTVSLEQMIDWTAAWIGMNGPTLNKPTHFETRDGAF